MMFFANLKTRLRWRKAEWSRSAFISFAPALKLLCNILQPDHILEFGPGYSTQLFLKHTLANIVSIETDRTWYDNYKNLFNSPRLQLIHKLPNWDITEFDAGVQKFSLIFVDGGDRTAELKFSYNLIDANGVVFLHDAHRDDYEAGIKQYPFVYFPEKHSCILVKNQVLYQQIKSIIPHDYSCACAYCSSAPRQKYLSQFLDEA